MKSIYLLLAMLFASSVFSQNQSQNECEGLTFNVKKTVKDGNWDDPQVWEGNSVPHQCQDVEINHRVHLRYSNTLLVDDSEYEGYKKLNHYGLISIGYRLGETTSLQEQGGLLQVYGLVHLHAHAGVPNIDKHNGSEYSPSIPFSGNYSKGNDHAHIDHNQMTPGRDLIEAIPEAHKKNFFKGSSIIIR